MRPLLFLFAAAAVVGAIILAFHAAPEVLVNSATFHFGRGLVGTPNDFGRMGTRPSHPELLDWLANRFIEGGWTMKPLHRMILLSSTYQQSSITPLAPDSAATGAPNALAHEVTSRMRLASA